MPVKYYLKDASRWHRLMCSPLYTMLATPVSTIEQYIRDTILHHAIYVMAIVIAVS